LAPPQFRLGTPTEGRCAKHELQWRRFCGTPPIGV